MTRFNITLQEGVDMVLWATENARGGEIFVPKIPSYRITDLALAVDPNCEQKIVGIRPGEKIHEEMITTSDSLNTVDFEIILQFAQSSEYSIDEYCRMNNAALVSPGFSYDSGTNPDHQ